MTRQAERCIEQRDEDWTEWFEQKRWGCFNKRDSYDEEANKVSRDMCKMMGERGELEKL